MFAADSTDYADLSVKWNMEFCRILSSLWLGQSVQIESEFARSQSAESAKSVAD
jgi:hypothetical protein